MNVQRSPPRGISGSQPDLSELRDDYVNQRKRKSPDCSCNHQEGLIDLQRNLMDFMKSTLDTQNKEIQSAFKTIHNDLSVFKDEMRSLTHSIQKISDEQTQIKNDICELKSSTTMQENKVESINKKVAELTSTIEELSEQLQTKEQHGRMNNLEISGIPVLKGENLMNTLNNITAKIGFSLLPHDIDYIHRVRRFAPKSNHNGADSDLQSSTSIPNIIVRFTQRSRKNEMLAAVHARRGLTTADAGLNGPSKPIFINDHLTPQNKLLYKQARLLAKEKSYKYIWLSECKILLRKNDTAKVILVSNESDLLKIK